MSLFDGFKKKKKRIEQSYSANINDNQNSEVRTVNNEFFKTGDKVIISGISSNMISVLRMLFIAFKNDGHVTMNDIKKNLSYAENKEFEDYLIALGKTTTIDGTKTYLQLAEEFMCPPANLSNDETIVFRLAHDIVSNNNPDYSGIENAIRVKISESKGKDYSCMKPSKLKVEYTCPTGAASPQALQNFDTALKKTLENVAIDAGIECWFRYYKELTMVGFEFANNLYRNGQAVTDMMKLPGMKGNANTAFSVLCGIALHAGLVAGKEYCDTMGDVAKVKSRIMSMRNDQILDCAAKITGYEHGNDQDFIDMLSVIPRSAASFVANNKSNTDMFMKSMLVALKTVFEFGTGLYYEY